MRFILPAALALAAQLSCFNVDFNSLSFSCDPKTSNDCPDGQICNAATRTCGPIVKPYAPPAVPTRACPSGMGYDVSVAPGGGTTFACPTIYSQLPPRTAEQQCINGTHLCTSADAVNLTVCDQIAGAFFIADVPVQRTQNGSLMCGAATAMSVPLWAGCGGDEPIAISCSKFQYAAECNLLPQGFTCVGNKITDTANSAQLSGVLCCL